MKPQLHASIVGFSFFCFTFALAVFAATSSFAADADDARGKAAYDLHCAACHGAAGDGKGLASVWLFPRPRDFSAGQFKIQSTPNGSLPADDDLLESITRGLPGTSMPGFAHLPEADRRALVSHIKQLTAFTDSAGRRVNRFEEAARKGKLKPRHVVPSEPPADADAVATGRDLFIKFACNACHGDSGAGDGPTAATLKDSQGFPLLPRDFNTAPFRGGHSGRDIYLRILTGMAGTPMPPFGPELMSPEERWALVHYIRSLRRPDAEVRDILTLEDAFLRVRRVKKLPTDPADTQWERFDPVRIPLNPLWPEPNPIYAVAVTALHDGRRLAVLCQWRDEIANGAPVRVQDFQDGIALQFSMNGTTPFLGMGDKDNPVNLWFWRAGWQQEADGRPHGLREQYPSMHVDLYTQTNTLFLTAEAAKNLIALPHKSPVEDANARGFGTLKSQPVSQQNVQGKGIWRDGHWNVVLARELNSSDADDVKLKPKQPVPVSFAVWNGEQRDRNGRKVISNWFQLLIEP